MPERKLPVRRLPKCLPIHYVRLVFISEDAPDYAIEFHYRKLMSERDPDRIEQMLLISSQAVNEE